MLERSRNLKFFKHEVGQLNHFLITIEVGLKNITSSTTVPDDFKTSWNPRRYQSSVDRSEVWARKSALTYICSAVEAYFESIFNEPPLIHEISLLSEYNRIKGERNISPTISWKFKKVNSNYHMLGYEKDLVQLMIFWRNGLVHNLTDYSSHPDFSSVEANLLANKLDIHNNHCHLDIEALLERFKQKKIPTFKETTSMIKATIKYLYELDLKLIVALDKEKYIQDCIMDYMRTLSDVKKKEYFMHGTKRRVSYLHSALQQYYGFIGKSQEYEYEPLLVQIVTEMAGKDQNYFTAI